MYGGISVGRPFCLSDCSAWGWDILLFPWFGAWTFSHPVVTCTTPIQFPLYYSGWAETAEAGNLEPQVTWTNPTFVWILPNFSKFVLFFFLKGLHCPQWKQRVFYANIWLGGLRGDSVSLLNYFCLVAHELVGTLGFYFWQKWQIAGGLMKR